MQHARVAVDYRHTVNFNFQFDHDRLGWRNVSSAHSYYEAACGGLEGDHLLTCFKASTFEMEEFMDDAVAKGSIQIVVLVFLAQMCKNKTARKRCSAVGGRIGDAG